MSVWPSVGDGNRASPGLVAADVGGLIPELLIPDWLAELRGSGWALGPTSRGEQQAAAGSLGLAARRGPLPSLQAPATGA